MRPEIEIQLCFSGDTGQTQGAPLKHTSRGQTAGSEMANAGKSVTTGKEQFHAFHVTFLQKEDKAPILLSKSVSFILPSTAVFGFETAALKDT